MTSRITAALTAAAAITAGLITAAGPAGATAVPASASAAGATILVASGRAPAGTPGNATVVHTLGQAQAAARARAGRENVTVELAPGTYRVAKPLTFTAADSGRDGHTVTWTSAPGGTAVLSGASQVTGWRLHDAANGIWEAKVPPGTMYLENAYAFLQPGQWYLDSGRGKLYYRATAGQNPASLDVELPRLQSLVHISGSYASPVSNLAFRGISFTGTTWLQPSTSQGYADQQGGAHIVGAYTRPADALTSCQNGCPLFEATRNQWWQVPAAVQVSAARDISFSGDTFTDLGQVGLGIGNDADATASGTGLGASDISVSDSQFTQDAGSAITVGGIQPDAHHPSDPAMIVKDISLTGNTITAVARDYKDSPGILSTYVDHAVISHNTLSDLPYDGIDLGWGWGTNDPGGNEYYQQAGLYSYQPVYQTPTTLKDNVVSDNLIYDTKNSFYDGGSIYNLSASPGTVITGNYIYDNHDTFGVLLDQGSRYITMTGNVLDGCSNWVYVNADTSNVDTYHTMDNLMSGNWYNAGTAHAPDGTGYDNVVTGNTAVTGDAWPSAAQAVIDAAGAGH